MEQIESIQKANRQRRLAEWSQRVEACRSSGLPVGRWCQENGIAVSTYFAWQRKVFKTLKEIQEVTFAEVPVMKCCPPFRTSGSIPGNQRRAGPGLQGSGSGHAAGAAPGGEVMLSDFTGAEKVYIAGGYTDLRKGIDGLAALVQSQFQLDPFTNTLFLFCGRRCDRIKALYWEGNGFVLLYKRLENGSFQWPRNGEAVRKLTAQQYRWLMEGLQIDQPRAHKTMAGMSMV